MKTTNPLCNGFTSVQENIIPILRSLKSKEASFIVLGTKKKDNIFQQN